MTAPRALIGCETSGTFRRAFAARGWEQVHRASPGPDRWKLRSKSWSGMARASADQWGRWAEHRMEGEAG